MNKMWNAKRIAPYYLLVIYIELVTGCPDSCVCKWKNGKQTVECVDKGLLIIPDGMDSGTQVLEFSGNNLQALHKEKFLKMELTNLQRIYLSRCHIRSIDDQTFKGLTNLVELDLSENMLEMIPTNSFIDCPLLMRLTLSANPIKIVRKESFSHLVFLNTLELSRCEISQVEAGAFQGLHSLEWLRLDGNQLKTIGGRVLPENLKGIELQGNQWECDCHLLEFRSWLDGVNIPQFAEPQCKGPEKLTKRVIKTIAPSELACLPDVSPTTLYLEISEGKNVSLQCQINAIPEAHVSWWFQGQLLQNDTMVNADTRLLYYIEEGGENKRSELFIYNTNSEDNGTFICSAENPAGVVQSNFTIRIILKEEPNYEVAVLPFEFLLIIISAISVSLIVICFALILSIVKCQSDKKYREQQQNLLITSSAATKDSLLQDSNTETYSDLSKEGSNVTLVDRQILLYQSDEILRTIPTTPCIPEPLNYQQENPDLINDTTESTGRRLDGDGEDKHPSYENFELSQHPFLQTAECNRRLCADVHLNPVGLLNARLQFNGNCYRTLPYNRGGGGMKRQQQSPRYRDAEFFYNTNDVRYTADGYPARSSDAEVETQFSDNESVRSCCSAPTVPWPPQHQHGSETILVVKKSVGAQTQTDIIPPQPHANKPTNRSVCSAIKVSETLTESPDEGYEGDSMIEANTTK